MSEQSESKWTDLKFIGTINANRSGSRKPLSTVPLRVYYDSLYGYLYVLGPRQRYVVVASPLSFLLCGVKYLGRDPDRTVEQECEIHNVLARYILGTYGKTPQPYYISHHGKFMWQTASERLPSYQVRGMKYNLPWILENIGSNLKEVDVL